MRAATPHNQSERLEELESYGILDSGAEESFDEVVELVKSLCDMPIALISLVDRDRQWFKARVGFELPQTDLDRSICSHAILDGDILEIPDTWLDARTRDNPLCATQDQPVRFYAGMPLITANGFTLGTLCVLDTRPRTLTALQRKSLRIMARQVMRQLDLRRALRNEEILRKEIDHRVKNSLQTVASFTRLYGQRAHSAETRDALAAIDRRVSAIAQLHSELYQTSEFDLIRLDRYLKRVTELLQGSLGPNVRLKTSLAPLRVDSRKAAALAMIVSEFTANADKHAFPDGRSGVVEIDLRANGGDSIHLECRDNGVGDRAVRPAAAETGIASIGKRLMESAAEQIGGSFALDSTPAGYRLTLITSPETAAAGPRAVALSAE
ncbi:histidine kinase dimerization/phosphoacceptor domain -containing protein [Roseivivax sp. CAU 1761]